MLSTSLSSSSIFLGTARAPEGDKAATGEDGAAAAFGEMLSALTGASAEASEMQAPGLLPAADGTSALPTLIPAAPDAVSGNLLPVALPGLPQAAASATAIAARAGMKEQAESPAVDLEPIDGIVTGEDTPQADESRTPLAAEGALQRLASEIGVVPQGPTGASAEAKPSDAASPMRAAHVPVPPQVPGKIPSPPSAVGTAAASAGQQNGRAPIALTVRTPGEAPQRVPATVSEVAPAEAQAAPIAPAAHKLAARQGSAEAGLLQQTAPATPTVSLAQSESSAIGQPVTAAAPAAAPAPMELAAVLDRLVAAREALMPAEAVLDIKHAEFGDMSIRFEQSTQGMLSVELTGADPDLQRAVTAANATERNPATQSDSSNARGDSAGQRGGAAERESSSSSWSSSGREAQSRNEREPPSRRAPAGARDEQTQPPSRSGVFA